MPIPEAVINPLAGDLESRIFSFRGVHKTVLRTTFNRDHLPLSFLVPTNTGERKPEAVPGIASKVDKDQMFFVSHSSAIPRHDYFRDFVDYTAAALRTEEKRNKTALQLCLCGERFSLLAVLSC